MAQPGPNFGRTGLAHRAGPILPPLVAIRSLVKAKRFRVATEICSVATVFHGIMSRQGILCRDKVWPRLKGLVSQHNILCHDRVGQGQEFYVTTEYFCVATEFSLGAGFLCRDKIFYVATEYGQMRGFVLQQRILSSNIVCQVGKVL